MTILNTRESFLDHEDPNYIQSRPKWTMGRIPDMCDYRKLSVKDMKEAFLLARLGQEVAAGIIPEYKGKPLTLTFTQSLIVGAAILDREQAEKMGLDFEKYRSVLMVTPSRYGKLVKHTEYVITPEGWKTHGELHAGDYVFHPSGKPIKVLAESPEGYANYRVHFQNGQTIDCHGNHEWVVWDRSYKKLSPRPERKVLQYGRYITLETRAMYQKRCTHLDNGVPARFYVDPPQPLQLPKKKQPLDPYFLGCWLGDGTATKPLIALSPEKAKAILPHLPYTAREETKFQGCSSYAFTHQGIRNLLREIGVLGNKHIPDIYKYASPEQQQALLAGLIDTDGYIDKGSGRVIITCANETLAKDILELLTIMGCCPYETVIPPTTSSSGIVGRHDVHMIGFQPSYDLPIHRNKLTRVVPHQRIGIVKIEEIEPAAGKCVQVDSPDGLYLVGRQLVPTHNSFLNAIVAIAKAGAEGKEVRIGGASKDKAGIIQEKIVELLPHSAKAIQDGLIVTDTEGDVNKKIQRMATQVSKDALSWKNGGSIKLFSTNEKEKNAQVASAGAIGIGGDFVILDEIQLMTPMGFRTSSRFMMENPDTKRFCVGNPQINGHFKELYDDPKTFVIHINEISAIIEERMSRRGIELTDIPTYSNEYRAFVQVEFPDENSGTRFFPTLPRPIQEVMPQPTLTRNFIGIDSAYKGGDSLTITLLSLHQNKEQRWIVVNNQYNLKEKYGEWNNDTTLNIALDILKIWEDGEVVAGAIDIGFGIHIYEALMRLSPNLALDPVAFQQRPTDWRVESGEYNALWAANARSEMHLDLRDLCEGGHVYLGGNCYDDIVNQMREVNSALETTNKIKIEPKRDIKRRIGRSPDNLDSLCLAVRAMVLSGALSSFEDSGYTDESDLVEFY